MWRRSSPTAWRRTTRWGGRSAPCAAGWRCPAAGCGCGLPMAVPTPSSRCPVTAATALPQDLAAEVALRTREVEAQRNVAARIIAPPPVGLYVIDRTYVIRAWNRKRESGTQGVAREDAVGREIFELLDRQPR